MGRVRKHNKAGYRETLTKRWNRDALIRRDGMLCQLCLEPMASVDDVTIDHITPQCRGGTDRLDNLRLVHPGCNRERGDGFFK